MVGTPRLELGTSSLSETRSNQLSYAPMFSHSRAILKIYKVVSTPGVYLFKTLAKTRYLGSYPNLNLARLLINLYFAFFLEIAQDTSHCDPVQTNPFG